ncbi:MAG: c-type cytochrome [Polyangiaceae bacterium]
MRPLRLTRAVLLAVAVSGVLGCDDEGAATAPDPVAEGLRALRAFEAEARAAARFDVQPTADRVLGDDPYRVAALPGGGFVGTLRGASRLVVLDARGEPQQELATPEGPTGLSVVGDRVWVSGSLGRRLARYRVVEGHLEPDGDFPAPGVAPRDLAASEAGIYVIDERAPSLHYATLDEAGEPGRFETQPACAGAIGIDVVEPGGAATLLLRCLVDHAVLLRPLEEGIPRPERDRRIVHDGPIWSASLSGDHLVLGGVEDHPLDRREGFFGHIDSFLFAYDLTQSPPRRVASLNLSERGVITPKALAPAPDGGLFVTGYGGERALSVALAGDHFEVTASFALPPGTHEIAVGEEQLIASNPLLDRWQIGWGDARDVTPPDDPEARLGEILLFTGLMAPFNGSEGAHSRFACETCHFEGGIDGRRHHTGRGEIHATTQPLFGLFNNRPHFSRALDQDLSKVAHAEFRVAGAGSGHHPWFVLETGERPWLRDVVGRDRVEPLELRRAVMRFLMRFAYRPNPRVLGRSHFDPKEARGAEVFAARCEHCHAARLSTDDPTSAVPRADWERLVLSPSGPIVWAKEGYHATGIEPRVHPEGARAPSLRRIEGRGPHFTDGSASRLENVLAAFVVDAGGGKHRAPEGQGTPLSEEEREALSAFLRLL